MLRRSLALAAGLALAAPALAAAAPVTVDLRVEGLTQTIYEAPVTTDAKVIDKGDGPHPCNGTNGGVNSTPGPTMTTALDDGSIAGGFTWDGTWFDGFDDFGIDRIGPDATDNDNGRYWGYALNYTPTQVGGCQQHVAQGDEVLFAYDFFSKRHLLRLTGPQRAAVGERFEVRVVDGQDGSPIPGAQVGGVRTDADGRATLAFDSSGEKRLKAEEPSSVRSNALAICVYVPDSGECGTVRVDRTPPEAQLTSIADGARLRRSPRVLAGTVSEETGIHQVYVRLRMVDRGGCRWLSGAREVFSRPRTCARARYIRIGDSPQWSYQLPLRLPRGARYIVDVKALDRALNVDREQVRFRVLP